MGLHHWSKDSQKKSHETINTIEKIWGGWAYPISIAILLMTIPLMFIELVTWSNKKDDGEKRP